MYHVKPFPSIIFFCINHFTNKLIKLLTLNQHSFQSVIPIPIVIKSDPKPLKSDPIPLQAAPHHYNQPHTTTISPTLLQSAPIQYNQTHSTIQYTILPPVCHYVSLNSPSLLTIPPQPYDTITAPSPYIYKNQFVTNINSPIDLPLISPIRSYHIINHIFVLQPRLHHWFSG